MLLSQKIRNRFLPVAAAVVTAALLTASSGYRMDTVVIEDIPIPLAGTAVLTPQTGSESYSGAAGVIDVSNVSEGYVLCKYTGSRSKIKVQIVRSGGSTYTYDLKTDGSYEVYPLTSGSGSYTVSIFEHVSGNQYAMACQTTVDVSLRDARLPFLYPNQYVNFSAGSATVKKAAELTGGSSSDLDAVTSIYNYVVNNISYDTSKAAAAQSGSMTGYLPVVDNVLATGTGICFDYAALMAAMLRSQGIPTQLRIGYVSSGVYHAWLGVYTTEQGWVNDLIYFDGQSWKLMDPTFAAGNGSMDDIMQFIGDGSNYNTMFTY